MPQRSATKPLEILESLEWYFYRQDVSDIPNSYSSECIIVVILL